MTGSWAGQDEVTAGADAGAGERATPFYCPYCGDEDLRPHGDKGGSWHCRGCARVFTLKIVGLEVS